MHHNYIMYVTNNEDGFGSQGCAALCIGIAGCRFLADVGQPVAAALSRCCGIQITITKNARSPKVEGLPDFQCWYDDRQGLQDFDFTGGEGKVSIRLHACYVQLPMSHPKITCK